MDVLRRFIRQGKPVVGIRTASHAFTLDRSRQQMPEGGYQEWLDFDREIFGCHYHSYFKDEVPRMAQVDPSAEQLPIMTGISREPFLPGSNVYKLLPLEVGATAGATSVPVKNEPLQPVAVTFLRADGGRSFYTSLGHVDDFQNPTFLRLLVNAIHWAAEAPIDEIDSIPSH